MMFRIRTAWVVASVVVLVPILSRCQERPTSTSADVDDSRGLVRQLGKYCIECFGDEESLFNHRR